MQLVLHGWPWRKSEPLDGRFEDDSLQIRTHLVTDSQRQRPGLHRRLFLMPYLLESQVGMEEETQPMPAPFCHGGRVVAAMMTVEVNFGAKRLERYRRPHIGDENTKMAKLPISSLPVGCWLPTQVCWIIVS